MVVSACLEGNHGPVTRRREANRSTQPPFKYSRFGGSSKAGKPVKVGRLTALIVNWMILTPLSKPNLNIFPRLLARDQPEFKRSARYIPACPVEHLVGIRVHRSTPAWAKYPQSNTLFLQCQPELLVWLGQSRCACECRRVHRLPTQDTNAILSCLHTTKLRLNSC